MGIVCGAKSRSRVAGWRPMLRGVTYKSTKKCTRFKRVNQAVVVAILVWIYGAVHFTELVKYSRRSKRWNSLAITDEFRQSYNPDLRLPRDQYPMACRMSTREMCLSLDVPMCIVLLTEDQQISQSRELSLDDLQHERMSVTYTTPAIVGCARGTVCRYH